MRQTLDQQFRDRTVEGQRIAEIAVNRAPQQVEILLENPAIQPVIQLGLGQVLRGQGVDFDAGSAEHDRQRVAGQQVQNEIGDAVGTPEHQQRLRDSAEDITAHGAAISMSLNSANPSAVQ